MIILLDTSSAVCKLTLIDGDNRHFSQWEAQRNLAKDIHKFLINEISKYGKTWRDISAVGVFEGPGSFTGLRIGITVMNTIADAMNIPIAVGRGENWQDVVLVKLASNINEKIVLPFYGSEAHITTPKK